ncbi:Flap-structured DNA-binding and RNA-binding protein [Coemansia sp. RSA 2673]|nr:Flap-structured DNA-binding and RNA-binding protein [Coemansia sp. RSA 2673]
MNRTSGIAARRSVSNRLSIAVKSPRDTMQTHQQQQLAATLAQMTMASSPLGASPANYAPQHYEQQHSYGAMRGSPAPAPPPGYASPTPARAPFSRPAAATGGASAGGSIGGNLSVPSSPAALKPQEPVDLSLVRDIPAWLRSLRLHKYNDCFADMDWTDVVALSDDDLQKKGVSALGARRKMLKVFEAVHAVRERDGDLDKVGVAI